MSQAYNPHSIDLELQVRLMNLVMGEASDFERDQLQLLMEQRPELAAYCQHLEHLHGLLCVVGAGEPSSGLEPLDSDDAWQLSPDRRERLLAVLDGRQEKPNPKVVLANAANKKWLSIRTRWVAIGVTAAAACLVVSLRLQSSSSQRLASFMEDRFQVLSRELSKSEVKSRPAVLASPQVASGSIDSSLPLTRRLNTQEMPGEVRAWAVVPPGGPPGNMGGMPDGMGGMSSGKGGTANGIGEPSFGSPDISGPVGGGYGGGNGGQGGGASGYSTLAYGGPGNGALENGQFGGGKGSSGGMFGDGKPGEGGGIGGGSGGGGFGGRAYGVWGAAGGEGGQVGIPRFNAAGTVNAPAPQPETPGNGREDRFGKDFVNQPTSNTDTNANFYKASPATQVGQTVASNSTPSDARRYSLGDGRAYNLGTEVDLPKLEETKFGRIDPEIGTVPYNKAKIQRSDELQLPEIEAWSENNLSSDVSTTVSVPDGGTILLGGIKRQREGQTESGTPILSEIPYLNRLFNNNAIGRETDTLMMNVTPRIIIPEEEEETLGQFTLDSKEPSVAEKSNLDLTVAELKQKEAKADSKKDSLDAIALQQNIDDSERRIKNLPGKKLERDSSRGEVSLGLPFAPAPSPEVASEGRRGIKAAGKPAGPQQPVTLDEQSASKEAFSTFSLHVSDVSFKLAQAALNQGQWPEAAKIRIEEFVNAMDYHDPLPSENQKVACRIDQAIHPFLMQRNLLRVSMRTAATGRSLNTPLRLTILLDNSGSMERPDRRQSVLRAFQSLSQQLSANDQVTLISFASTPRLLADKVPGNEGAKLMQLIETLPSEGGTNIEAALMLAREKATEQQLAGAQNRIVMLTDGAVNLGNANPDSLAKLVTQMRDTGIAFDAAGISALNLNDEVLETLTRQGDGRYYLIDSAESAGETFANQIAGALRPSAQNVKVQVEFNPQRVGRYKLLGFEKHRLNKEDFRNDKVDAAEMAAAEAGVAVYQYEIKPNGSGDVGSVSVRFRDLSSGQMVERRWPILYESNTPRLEQSQPSMQLAASAAFFAAKLGGGPLADSVDVALLQKLLAKFPEPFASQSRVQELRAMIEQALTMR